MDWMSVDRLLKHFDYIHDTIIVYDEQTKEETTYQLGTKDERRMSWFEFWTEFGSRYVTEWRCPMTRDGRTIEICID